MQLALDLLNADLNWRSDRSSIVSNWRYGSARLYAAAVKFLVTNARTTQKQQCHR